MRCGAIKRLLLILCAVALATCAFGHSVLQQRGLTVGLGDARYLKAARQIKAMFGGMRPCADYIDVSTGGSGTTYKDSNGFFATQFITSGAVTRMSFLYPGWIIATTNGDKAMTNTENWQTSFEYPIATGTVPIPITFRGLQNVTIDPGGYYWSDPISVNVPAHAAFRIRTYNELVPLYSGTLSAGNTAAGNLVLPNNVPNNISALTGATLVITGGTGYSAQVRNACKIASVSWSAATGLVTITQDGTFQTTATTDNTSTFTIYPSGSNGIRLMSRARSTNDWGSWGSNPASTVQTAGHNYISLTDTALSAISGGAYTSFSPTSAGNGIYVNGPIAVIGNTTVPAVGALGDDFIAADYCSGNKSSSSELNGGYGQDFYSLACMSAGIPQFGLMRFGEPGGTAAEYSPSASSPGVWNLRMIPLSVNDYVLLEIGSVDIFTTHVSLAQVEASITAIVQALSAEGVNVILCTIPPHTTDSAGQWISQAGQATVTGESNRTGCNDWERTQFASIGAYACFDVALMVEANASNVLTKNGGYWYVGPNVAIKTGVYSSTATSGSTTTLVDTVNGPTDSNLHNVGQVIQVTSAANSSVHTGLITGYSPGSKSTVFAAGLSGGYTVVAGDTYVILGNTATTLSGGAGIYPSDYGQKLMSAAVNTSLFLPVASIDMGIAGRMSIQLGDPTENRFLIRFKNAWPKAKKAA